MFPLISLKVLALRLALSHVLFSLAFLKSMYKVLSAESCSGGDTPDSVSHQPIKIPHQKASCPPSVSILGGGAKFCQGKQLRKSSCAASAAMAMPNSAC
jgi:hypothetical protein